ncbi:MAG: hypothetical protein IJY92_02015 [Alphaproteobacteria bacterium]|nr:hypothetical protein [Alphaproteobacteria bacterium]
MRDTDEYDTGKDHGQQFQEGAGTLWGWGKKGWTATLDVVAEGGSWLLDSKAGKYVRGFAKGAVQGTPVGEVVDAGSEFAHKLQEGDPELRQKYLGTDENGRAVFEDTEDTPSTAEPTPTKAPEEEQEETDSTPPTKASEEEQEETDSTPTPTKTPEKPKPKTSTPPKTSRLPKDTRGDAIQITYRNPDGTDGKIFLNADQVKMVRSFARGEFDAENGFKLKVLEDSGESLSSLYYEPDEVVGGDYRRKGDTAKHRLSFANTAFTLTNSQYHAALKKINELDRASGRVDPVLESALPRYKKTAPTQTDKPVETRTFTPHTPHQDGLKVNFIIPGTDTNSMVVLSADQVAAIRSFVKGKRDVNGGYKLWVTANSGEPFSPLYYQLNKQGNAYVRIGEDPSSVAVAPSVSTFKLNETQFHAAVLGIFKADAERGYIDPDLKKLVDAMTPKDNGGKPGQQGPQAGQVVYGPNGQPIGVTGTQTTPQGGQVVYGPNGQPIGVTSGKQTGQQGQVVYGPNGQPIGVTGGQVGGGVIGPNGQVLPATTTESDAKNFFLSAGNWVNNAFNSLGNMIPISLISNFIKMIGNCIGGLLKTIGYVLEGEWGKAGTELFGWIKDAAIVGGVAYGAYFLKKKISNYFKDDEKTSTSSSSSNSSSTNSSTNTNTDLSDLLAGILNNSNNSSGSSSTDDANKDVYVGLNHSSNGQVAGTVTTHTDASGTTQRLLDTSDRFLLAGELRDPNSDGTLWRVKVDKTK